MRSLFFRRGTVLIISWKNGKEMDRLKQIWAAIGIPCPFCLHSVPAFSPVVSVEPERSAESNLSKRLRP